MKPPHAVTPTDTRSASGSAAASAPAWPPAQAATEASALAELTRLAFGIADAAARSDIELHCIGAADAAGVMWYETGRLVPGCDPGLIETALRYLHLRGTLRVQPDDAARVAFMEGQA